MSQFSQYKSVKHLKELSKSPLDLTKEGVFTEKRIQEMATKSGNWNFLYAGERVNEDVLVALFELAKEAKVHEKMVQMQSGDVLNFVRGCESENRKVLHTATRDFFGISQAAAAAVEAKKLAWREVEKLKQFLLELSQKKDAYTDLVQIGIGGSALGPSAVYTALKAFQNPKRRVHFIANLDPDDAASVLKHLDLSKTLVVSVSKSGTTQETLSNEEIVREQFRKKGLLAKNHMIAVTGEKSPMDDPSRYERCFYIWDFIGGRFSATSMVGGVLLGFALGYEQYEAFLKGAHQMDQIALQEGKTNLPLFAALLSIWNRNFLHLETEALVPYSQALSLFPAHIQQCAMESNGKSVDQEGEAVDFDTSPIVWGEVGTNSQHSFYQLLHQGTSIVPLEFIGFRESQYGEDVVFQGSSSQEKLLSHLFAQSIAFACGKKDVCRNRLFLGNRPNRILLGKRLTPEAMGELLAYYEHKISFQGFIWGINSFDQEGVQLGKVLASRMNDLFSKKGQKPFLLGQAYLNQLKVFF